MHEHIGRSFAVARGRSPQVVDAATAVLAFVAQHDQRVIRCLRRSFAQHAIAVGQHVAIAVKRIERGAEGGVAPHALARIGEAALGRGHEQSAHIEALCVALERFGGQQDACKSLRIGCELRALGLGVAFGDDKQVDLRGRWAFVAQCQHLARARQGTAVDKAAAWVNLAAPQFRERAIGRALVEHQARGPRGLGKALRFFECAPAFLGCAGRLPFAVDAAESARPQQLSSLLVMDAQAVLARVVGFDQLRAAARPLAFDAKARRRDLFRVCRAAVHIIKAQCAPRRAGCLRALVLRGERQTQVC